MLLLASPLRGGVQQTPINLQSSLWNIGKIIPIIYNTHIFVLNKTF
ncbi:hypothetical protein [Candidatus Erwinia haradaeae]|nr:hypothetical protein [Candidatus Erwinia haradaeae]